MKVKIISSNPEEQGRINSYAEKLLSRTLEPHLVQIRSVSVKVCHSIGIPLAEYGYHCTVQILMKQGPRINTEVRNCDEILAIYHAVDRVKGMLEYQSKN